MPKHASESYVNGYASPLVHTHVATTDLTATGTKDNTTYLRGDNTWATPAGGGGGGTSDTLLGSPLISNAKYINVTDDSFTSGDILYQVPTGRKAVVTSASFYNGSGAGNTNYMYYGLLLDTPTPTLTVIAITTASTANVTRRTVNGRPFILEAVDTVRWSAASTTSCVVALTILEFDDSSPLVSKSASAATGTYRNNHTTVGTSGLQPLYTPASGKQAAILTDANLLMSTFTPTSDLGLNYSQNSAGASGTYWVAIYPSGTIAANTTPYYASASAPNLTNSASTAQRIVLSHGVITDGYEMGLNVVSGSITSSNPFFWVNVVETDIT